MRSRALGSAAVSSLSCDLARLKPAPLDMVPHGTVRSAVSVPNGTIVSGGGEEHGRIESTGAAGTARFIGRGGSTEPGREDVPFRRGRRHGAQKRQPRDPVSPLLGGDRGL